MNQSQLTLDVSVETNGEANSAQQNRLRQHPAAMVYPPPSKESLEAIACSVREFGQVDEISEILTTPAPDTDEECVADGYWLYLACLEAGLKPKLKKLVLPAHVGLPDFLASRNVARRDLSKSQRACVAVLHLAQYELAAKQRQGKKAGEPSGNNSGIESRVQVAKQFGVNEHYVSDAKRLLKERKDLFDKVHRGELKLLAAMAELEGGAFTETVPASDADGDPAGNGTSDAAVNSAPKLVNGYSQSKPGLDKKSKAAKRKKTQNGVAQAPSTNGRASTDDQSCPTTDTEPANHGGGDNIDDEVDQVIQLEVLLSHQGMLDRLTQQPEELTQALPEDRRHKLADELKSFGELILRLADRLSLAPAS